MKDSQSMRTYCTRNGSCVGSDIGLLALARLCPCGMFNNNVKGAVLCDQKHNRSKVLSIIHLLVPVAWIVP